LTLNSGSTAAPAADLLPRSATHGAIAASGAAGLLLALAAARIWRPFEDVASTAVAVMTCTALGIFVPDLVWQKIWRRTLAPADAGGSIRASTNWPRVLTKYAGLCASVGAIAGLYALFPEYHADSSFYRDYWSVVGPHSWLWPAWMLAAIPYIAWVDRRMDRPSDGLFEIGRLVMLQWTDLQGRLIGQHLLGWLVKGYFLPLMFTYFCSDLRRLLSYDLAHLATFGAIYDFAFFGLYLLDVALVSMTYVMSLRVVDTQIRSSEPTLFGWVIALCCYQPFWSLASRQYIAYDGGRPWGSWLGGMPWIYDTWGSLILVLTVIYVWSTIAFGGRFSNLTHRGIVTNGPYRYSKHPAYLAKNLSWWLISMPFMVDISVLESLRRCALLLLLNGIYYLRAKTEERHLSLDPVYQQYMAWIDRHGLLRGIARVPVLGALARLRLNDRALRDDRGEPRVVSALVYRSRD
jgi:protein-S-isoprenylcysteine O-methyltransferase Ste14